MPEHPGKPFSGYTCLSRQHSAIKGLWHCCEAIDKKKEAHKDLLSIIVKKQQYRRRTAKVPAAAG
jgi:hypothetical protein